MVRSLSLILTLFFLAACNLPSLEDKKPLIVMPPTGTVEATSLVSAFSKTCLSHFPDNEATIAAFKRSGFSDVEERSGDFGEYWLFSHKNMNISAASGNGGYWLYGGNSGGGIELFQFCEVWAELSNPEHIEIALEQLVTSAGENVELLVNEDNPSRRSGTVENSVGAFRVTFDQFRAVRNTYNGKLPEKCGGLEKCLTWGRAELRVQMPRPPGQVEF